MKRIAIVGAGPAGCHLAHRLAATDHEILLFDHRVPYEKPCGGGLSPLVGRRFPDVMGLPMARNRPSRLLLCSSNGHQVDLTLGSPDWAIVSRADLGRALLERAVANGCVVHVRQRVTGVERKEAGWCLRTASGGVFLADFLVGVDGVRSVVRQQVVGPIPRQHLGLAVDYLVQGTSDALVFQTFADLRGYLWSFPRLDHANVGIVGPLKEVRPRDLWQRLDRFLDNTCPTACRENRWAGLLPMAQDPGLWDTPCAGPGWALLGDAAGHVHPITGEGIAYALWSADLLAEALLQENPDLYESLWRERYGRTLASAAAVIQSLRVQEGAFEVFFHLAMVNALSSGTEAA